MPAAGQPPSGNRTSGKPTSVAGTAEVCVEDICRAAADGRRTARMLSHWLKRFDLSEPEFQVLWQLRRVPGIAFDQRTLAKETALSPALVSATVERLRRRGWMSHDCDESDRRRHLWYLTDAGRSQLALTLGEAHLLVDSAASVLQRVSAGAAERKEAA